MYSYAFLILLLPFLSFLLLGLLGMKMPKKVAGYIGTALMLVVVCLCYYTAYQYFFGVGREASGLYPTVTAFNLTWLDFGKSPIFGIDLLFKIGFRLTPISTMMLLVITTVSLMVHIYSFGYMAERDENYQVEATRRASSASTPSSRSSRCRCSASWWRPTSSRCISSGSWWVSAPTCSSVSTIRSTQPSTPPRKRSSSPASPTCSSCLVS